MPEDRYSVISSAVAICRLIADAPMTRAELGAHLGLHERTIRRIVDALRLAGVPITQARRGEGVSPLAYSLGDLDNARCVRPDPAHQWLYASSRVGGQR